MLALYVTISLPVLLTGCYTPQARARAQSATFQRLTPQDQALALRGQVREGMSQGAVLIAWGAPTHIQPASPAQGPYDAWVYSHAFLGPGGGFFGIPRGLTYNPARGRYYFNSDDYYETPIYIRGFGQVSTDVPYRKAVFNHGRVVNHEEQTHAPNQG